MTQWLFAWSSVAELFHRFVRRRKIVRQRPGPFAFTRTLVRQRDAIVIRDEIRTTGAVATVRAVVPAADIEVHSPSARFRSGTRYDLLRVQRDVAERWASVLNASGRLTLITTYERDPNGHLISNIRQAS